MPCFYRRFNYVSPLLISYLLFWTSVGSTGKVTYAGITNNVARRSAEQLASKGIEIEPLITGLSRSDARAVEQALIEIHGLERMVEL